MGEFLVLPINPLGVAVGLLQAEDNQSEAMPTVRIVFQERDVTGVTILIRHMELQEVFPRVNFQPVLQCWTDIPQRVYVTFMYQAAPYELLSALFPPEELKTQGQKLLEGELGVMLFAGGEFNTKDRDTLQDFTQAALNQQKFDLQLCGFLSDRMDPFCTCEMQVDIGRE